MLKRYVEVLLAVDRAQKKYEEFDYDEGDQEGENKNSVLKARLKEAELQADSRLRILKEWGRLKFPDLDRFIRKNW